MTKREIGFLVVGAVLAYGVFVFFSAEVPEVPEELTVAEVAERLAEIEEEIATWNANIEYLKTEITAARMRQRGLSVMAEVPASWWDELRSCWRGSRCPPSVDDFVVYCKTEPQCKAAIEAWTLSREGLRVLENVKFNREFEQAKLELNQKMRNRERE